MSYSVPNVAGVPALLGGFAASAALTSISALADVAGTLASTLGQQWGIFLNGSPVVIADTVTSFDFRKELVIADYPIERGAFESYDKVERPFDVRFRFAAGGSEANRTAMIASIKSIAGDMNLYDFITPTDICESVSIGHVDYRRTSQNGVGLLQVDVWGWQVIVNSTSGLSGDSTKSPGSADPVISGSVETTPISGQATSAVTSSTAYSP